MFKRLTAQAQEAVAAFLCEGGRAIDATAGNGHDTAFLAEQVGESGSVFAVDCQETAISATRRRLDSEGLADRVEGLVADHADLKQHLPAEWVGHVSAAMFNLGYLPWSDRGVVTEPDSTVKALQACSEVMSPEAIISVMIYTRHEGGNREKEAVLQWSAGLADKWTCEHREIEAGSEELPSLLLISRRPIGL